MLDETLIGADADAITLTRALRSGTEIDRLIGFVQWFAVLAEQRIVEIRRSSASPLLAEHASRLEEGVLAADEVCMRLAARRRIERSLTGDTWDGVERRRGPVETRLIARGVRDPEVRGEPLALSPIR